MDMWSVGVSLLEIATGESMFELLDKDEEGLKRWYCESENKEIEERVDSMIHNSLMGEEKRYLRRLLSKLLNVDGEERMRASDCLNHSFFSGKKGKVTSSNERFNEELISKVDELRDDVGEIKEGVESIQVRLRSSIEEMLREIKSNVASLNFDDMIQYGQIAKEMEKGNQDEGEMRGYEEELRKILNSSTHLDLGLGVGFGWMVNVVNTDISPALEQHTKQYSHTEKEFPLPPPNYVQSLSPSILEEKMGISLH